VDGVEELIIIIAIIMVARMSHLSSDTVNSDNKSDQEISWRRSKRLSSRKETMMSRSQMRTWVEVTLWALLLLVTTVNANLSPVQQQLFRRTPDNQTATVGDTVTLACSVLNKAGILQWTRDGFGLGTERNLQGYERYRMSGSEEEGTCVWVMSFFLVTEGKICLFLSYLYLIGRRGDFRSLIDGNEKESISHGLIWFMIGDYTLVIDHVTLEDDAVFQCQVSPGPPDSGIRELRSADAKLTIEVPTGAPQILQGDFLQTTEDREITLECISRAGKPAAEVTFSFPPAYKYISIDTFFTIVGGGRKENIKNSV